RQRAGRAFSPRDRSPGRRRQRKRKLFGGDQIGLVAPPGIVERFAALLGARVRWPEQQPRRNRGDGSQAASRDAGAQPLVAAVVEVHQNHPARNPGRARPLDQFERNLRFGRKADVGGNAGLLPARTIRGPVFGNIEPIPDRQAGKVIGHRQRHRHLTIGLLAKLPAILRLNADRMLALLGETRVINDPGFDRPLRPNRRHHQVAHLGQSLLVRPLPDPDKMQQRLVLRRGPPRRRARRHRFHALALPRKYQPGAIIPQRPRPIRVPQYARKRLNISGKSPLALEIHLSSSAPSLNPVNYSILNAASPRPSDSVRFTHTTIYARNTSTLSGRMPPSQAAWSVWSAWALPVSGCSRMVSPSRLSMSHGSSDASSALGNSI